MISIRGAPVPAPSTLIPFNGRFRSSSCAPRSPKVSSRVARDRFRLLNSSKNPAHRPRSTSPDLASLATGITTFLSFDCASVVFVDSGDVRHADAKDYGVRRRLFRLQFDL